MPAELNKLFVYGTLRKGASANFFLQKCRLEKPNVKARGYQMYCLGRYPAVVGSDDPQAFVIGDIYIVDRESLKRIDRFEGAGYRRTVDKELECFIYVAEEQLKHRFPRIASGDWLAYARENNIKGYP